MFDMVGPENKPLEFGNRRFRLHVKVGEGTGLEKFAVNMLVLGNPM